MSPCWVGLLEPPLGDAGVGTWMTCCGAPEISQYGACVAAPPPCAISNQMEWEAGQLQAFN